MKQHGRGVETYYGSVESHYGDGYFNNFQKEIGEFGGKANKFLFEKHILSSDTVLDFGCGGGFLLKNLDCGEKIGVELNPVARDYCNYINKVKCFESLEFLPDESVDVVISSHCLEHTSNPFELVSRLFKKLRKGGKIVIVVPLDNYRHRWVQNDVNNHLYSFSPMNLGNILQGCGFTNIQTEPILHKWIPMYQPVSQVFGFRFFHMLSWLFGKLVKYPFVQVKGIGIRPSKL